MSTMSLNIKNPRVHELARQAAERFGMSQTSVIEEALRRMLAADAGNARAARASRVDAVLSRVDAELTDEARLVIRAQMAELYDAQGLPR